MNDFAPFDGALRTTWRYPGGEVGVRAIPGTAPRRLLARVQCSDDLLALAMYLGAVRGEVETVCIPYLPYARQDRVAVPGDPVAIEVLARLLASTGVREFVTIDVHSPAAAAAFAAAGIELHNVLPLRWLERHLNGLPDATGRPIWFVAPDQGAHDRTTRLASGLSQPDRLIGTVHCRKVRDPASGALRGFRVEHATSPRDLGADPLVVVVDDICDGGGTFLGVAAALRATYGPLPLHLWTTHGIHSRGLDALASAFTTIGATDSFRSGRTHPQLRIIALQNEESPG